MTLSSPRGLDRFELYLRAVLAERFETDPSDLILQSPRRPELGEFALPCFVQAKKEGRNPAELAAELASELPFKEMDAQAVGPFLNFRIDREALAATVLSDALDERYGAAESDGTVLVEYSSPNIAKPMHVGHLRSTLIGACLARVFAMLGHKVVTINHIGDWGSQFGKLLAAWQRWGSEEALKEAPIDHLLDLYVRFHNEEGEDPSLAELAKAAFLALESGEENEERSLWRRFSELSLQRFDRVYQRLGSSFDLVRGESWYEDQLDPTLEWLEKADVLSISEGATIIDLSDAEIETPCMVKTSHGTTLYATRDIAAARSRWNEFQFSRCLYVVGAEQRLHFRQLKAALTKSGCEWAKRIEHIDFGLIRMKEGKLSTREGRVLLLEDLLDRAVELAREITTEKNPNHPNIERAAEEVGVGAVVFHDLASQRVKDVVFDWGEVLSFEGDTGPYLQYTHARCCAILRKADRAAPTADGIDTSLLADADELLVSLGRFPAALRDTAERGEPSVLSQYLLRLASAGNSFYRTHRVLGSGDALEQARLAAVDALRRTLASGLAILGVPAPQEM